MLRNYLVIAFRHFNKNRFYVLINIIGLAFALACCVVAYLNWQFFSQFDADHVHGDKIYRVNLIRMANGYEQLNGICPMPLGKIIESEVPQVTRMARVYPVSGNFKVNENLFSASFYCVDPSFFELFTFHFRHGHPSELKNKLKILINDELARIYFPDLDDPTGEMITYVSGGKHIDYLVAGVFEKAPENSSFQAEAYMHYDNIFDFFPMDENDWSSFNTTFVRVDDPGDISIVEKSMQPYLTNQAAAYEDYRVTSYYLDPFVGMSDRAERVGNFYNHWFRHTMGLTGTLGPAIMAILMLLLACFTFTNTSIAVASKRFKEIGIRKVLGSRRRPLALQFLIENYLLTFLALILGLFLAAYLTRAYSQLWPFIDIRLTLAENPSLLFYLILLLAFTGFMAGSYPAYYLTGFDPASILKGTLKTRGTNTFTRILLTLQFTISLLTITSAYLFIRNASFLKNYDMGYQTGNVLYTHVNDGKDFEAFKNELTGRPGIHSISGSLNSVTFSWDREPIRYGSEVFDVLTMYVGPNYLNTIGANLLNGRHFMADSRNDMESAIIINEQFVRSLGWDEPIGKRVVINDTTELFVVGVVRDLYLDGGLRFSLKPLVLRLAPKENFRIITVNTGSEKVGDVHALMTGIRKKMYPDELPTVFYLDEKMERSLASNEKVTSIFMFLGILALVLSVIGLYSLVSLNIVKRMKEISIRKILGASILGIVRLISTEFMVIMILGAVFGSVLSFFLTDKILALLWRYYTPLKFSHFAVTFLILLLISLATVGGKILNAASTNPADVLRNE